MKLQIEYVNIDTLKTYENNAKIHTAEQIEQIKNSIREFGMDDPIAVWKDNVIIEGHGRLIACKELGIGEVPIIRLDHLTDEQRRVYGIVHNKLTMNTRFDLDVLGLELEELVDDFDLTDFGFNEAEILEFTVDDSPEEIPSMKDLYPEAEEPQDVGETGDDSNADAPQVVQIPKYESGMVTPRVTREDLKAYESNAEALVTRRVIIVYRTDEEEQFIKQILGIDEDEQLGVVLDVRSLMGDK